MLSNIHIKNYILVENLSIDFSSGLNILTGETGAGKSMDGCYVNCIGCTHSTSIIRHSTDVCSILTLI